MIITAMALALAAAPVANPPRAFEGKTSQASPKCRMEVQNAMAATGLREQLATPETQTEGRMLRDGGSGSIHRPAPTVR